MNMLITTVLVKDKNPINITEIKKGMRINFVTEQPVQVGDILQVTTCRNLLQVVKVTVFDPEKHCRYSQFKTTVVQVFRRAANVDCGTICLSINKAREYFRSGNAELREIALQAFSEKDLDYGYGEIYLKTVISTPYITTLMTLERMAQFFNKLHSKANDVRFYIRAEGAYTRDGKPGPQKTFKVVPFASETSPVGTPVFNSREDAEKALKMLESMDILKNL